jgi:hypothetical protein
MKVRCDDRVSQPTELNVIFELVGLSIQRGGHSSGTSAVLGTNFGGDFKPPVRRMVAACAAIDTSARGVIRSPSPTLTVYI